MRQTDGPVSCFNAYPDGGISVNMLPTAEGELFLEMEYGTLKHMLEARAYSYMCWLAERCGLRGWEITHIFPMIGLRETYRLRGKYVLTREDLVKGSPYGLEDHIIASADHPADIHGSGHMLEETGRYGIPYECLLPVEIENLLVACRGASFTHMAAASARLSRTMLQLGAAAGEAAVFCIREGITPAQVNVKSLRRHLRII